MDYLRNYCNCFYFSVEFIGYYLDRNIRVSTMRKQLAELLEENSKLLEEQTVIANKRDKVIANVISFNFGPQV